MNLPTRIFGVLLFVASVTTLVSLSGCQPAQGPWTNYPPAQPVYGPPAAQPAGPPVAPAQPDPVVVAVPSTGAGHAVMTGSIPVVNTVGDVGHAASGIPGVGQFGAMAENFRGEYIAELQRRNATLEAQGGGTDLDHWTTVALAAVAGVGGALGFRRRNGSGVAYHPAHGQPGAVAGYSVYAPGPGVVPYVSHPPAASAPGPKEGA